MLSVASRRSPEAALCKHILLPTPFFERKKKLLKEPLANSSFLPLVVLYYAHAVVEAVRAIELLKLFASTDFMEELIQVVEAVRAIELLKLYRGLRRGNNLR
jgi:hypothetical protein